MISTAPVSMPSLPVGTPIDSPTFEAFVAPLETVLPAITPLVSSSNRRITFTFEYQLNAWCEFFESLLIDVSLTIRNRIYVLSVDWDLQSQSTSTDFHQQEKINDRDRSVSDRPLCFSQ